MKNVSRETFLGHFLHLYQGKMFHVKHFASAFPILKFKCFT